MTTSDDQSNQAFSYEAVAPDGQAITGTIDAAGMEEADLKLRGLQLQVKQLTPIPPRRLAALRGEDFLAFNEQLGQLAKAGLPVEDGLRLIADDIRTGPLAKTMHQVSRDLESGQSLPQAIETHRSAFPPLYSHLVDAGLRSGNLSGVLFNLGRHLTLVRQLHMAIWQAVSYPLMVISTALAVVVFMSFAVAPRLEATYAGFRIQLPLLTDFVLGAAAVIRLPLLWGIFAALLVAAFIVSEILRLTGRERRIWTALSLKIPVIGPIIRRSLVSRWCDAVRLGIEAGLDLPSSISLAGDAIDSRPLSEDGRRLVEILSSGGDLGQAGAGRLLPIVVVRAMQLASQRNDLPRTLAMMSDMYQQQARTRVEAVTGLVSPFLLLVVGLVVAVIALASILPMVALITAAASPVKH